MTPEQFARVQALFAEAIRRPAHERREFLAQTSCEDEEVLREVERLLSHATADDLLAAVRGAVVGALADSGRLSDPCLDQRSDTGDSIITSTLSHYKILAEIGRGGMGIVYRALDVKLNRTVAIKVLPEDVAQAPERLARFRREAQLLASLNHPHIATLFGFEQEEGRSFLVMELVEGEDLAHRLRRGALSLEEAISVARQVAEALEAAHERGVVHRDLKPANVKRTEDGSVKVLDFGLAKAMRTEESSSDPSQSPTVSRQATAAGALLGTADYMSPEQTLGKIVDKRTDIWAFGVVLFEMLTGTTPFPGEGVSDRLAAVLRAEIDWSRLPEQTPSSIRRLLRRCLTKDPRARLRDIGDARLELDAVDAPEEPAPKRGPTAQTVLLGLTLVLGVILGLLLARLHRPETAPAPVQRATLTLGRPLAVFSRGDRPAFALAPEGNLLVYRAWAKDTIGRPLRLEGSEVDETLLFLRRLDRVESIPLPGTEGAYLPFFSPDGQWVGFFANGKLKKVPIGGGRSTVITDAPDSWGACWLPDGTIVFNPSISTSLRRVPDSGGVSEEVTSLDEERGEQEHNYPSVLGDGDTVLFSVWAGDDFRIEALSLGTGRRKTVLEGGIDPKYAPTGDLLYHNLAEDLLAVPFDSSKLELTGPPRTMVRGLLTDPVWGVTQWAVSENGLLVYAAGGLVTLPSKLVWVDRQGGIQSISEEERPYDRPRLSPEGRRIAYRAFDEGLDVWVYDVVRSTHTRLTSSEGSDADPAWHPDGERIVYSSTKAGGVNLFWKSADGSGEEDLLVPHARAWRETGDWTPDGRMLVFHEIGAKGSDLWLFSTEDASVRPFRTNPFNERYPRLSPDGRWIAFQSDESGRAEIHVTRFPGPAAIQVISDSGGRYPFWSKQGDELFYQSLDGSQLISVSLEAVRELRPGRPRVLFETQNVDIWDTDLDGRRFLGVQRPELPRVTELQIVFNWFAELERP